jgi:hypothetical protein
MKTKLKVIAVILLLLCIAGIFIYFRYFFTYEQRNVLQRKIETITGQNLTITIFGFDGRIIKRWEGVQKISSGKARDGSGDRSYTFFYTRDNKYVQIPDSVWYIAEEE